MKIKKLSILLIVLIMAWGFPVYGLQGTITINNTSHVPIINLQFYAYRIFELDAFDFTNGSYNYRLDSRFDSFMNYPGSQTLKAYLESLIPEGENDPAATAKTMAMYDLAYNLWQYINDTPVVFDASRDGEALAGTDASSITITTPGLGFYLIYSRDLENILIDPNNPNGYTVASLVMLDTTDMTLNINIKADVPSIIKEVDDGGTWQNHTDANIGERAAFRIIGTVPNMLGYETYEYTVFDELSGGLSLDTGSVKVWYEEAGGDGVTIFTPGIQYELFIENNSFTARFTPDFFVGLIPGSHIIITYEAVLNENALDINYNKAWLEYSNNPHTISKGITPPDGADIYTYKFDIYKYAEGAAGDIMLPDAAFNLFDSTQPGTAIDFVLAEAGDITRPAIYRRAASDDTGIITNQLITPESGLIELLGLAARTYFLRETAAPNGYTLNRAEKVIEIIRDNVSPYDGSFTLTDDGTDTANTTIYFLNETGFLFPGTGGIGRLLFYITGGIIMAGALWFLFTNRKILLRK